MKLNISNPSWQSFFDSELSKDYFKALVEKLNTETLENIIYPEKENIFKAFELTSLKDIKAVILGQDPYHGEGEAHGLAFSVPPGVKIPPSLKNIYKELHDDLGIKESNVGDLTSWSKEGVFLLNTILTVRKDSPLSHKEFGWEIFTKNTLKFLNSNLEGIVFILWGKASQGYSSLIDESKHLVLKSVHPSPLSSYRGFFGSKPFSKCNEYLVSKKKAPINWELQRLLVK